MKRKIYNADRRLVYTLSTFISYIYIGSRKDLLKEQNCIAPDYVINYTENRERY